MGLLSPREAVRASLHQIELMESFNAFTELRAEALAEVAGARGPLAGVPVVVKDSFVDGGRAPTLGSRLRADWLQGTATVLERLRGAGAVVVGYSNLHEWMVGTTSLVSAFGPVGNPRDPSLIAGGSSGGSAAALAAWAAPLAIGTDAGGSIRIPAACCSVVGLKPSWGLVPTQGFVDDGSQIDHVGPMGRSVADVRVLLEVLAGTAVDRPSLDGLRVGVATGGFVSDVDPEVASVVWQTAEALRPHVSEVVDVRVGEGAEVGAGADGAVAPFILRDVARMLAARREDWQEVLQDQTRAVLARGAAYTGADRAAAVSFRAETIARWDATFREVDVVLTPTLPGKVATAEARSIELPSGVTSAEVAYVRCNSEMNLAGLPCLSLPCGELRGRQGVNVSLTAARGGDGVVLALGELLERIGFSAPM